MTTSDESRQRSPVNVDAVLASFDELWSPRIVTRVNDYDVRVARVQGEHLWHAHPDTDEFFLVLDGQFTIDVRGLHGADRTIELRAHDTFVVPRGIEHRPRSEAGATILMFEPTGTPTTGDYSGDVPEHIDATTGHEITH